VPEGHSLRLAARRLAPLAGQTVRAESRDPRGAAIARALDGATLGEAYARGKHLLLPLDDGRILHSHLRMRGSWRLFRAGERWSKPERLAWLILRSGPLVAVQFNGPVLELLRPGAMALHPVLSRLGPDVLDDDFDAGRAARRAILAAEDRQVAEVLLDQRIASGIGNIAKSEGLWTARANPFATPEQIGEERLALVYRASAGWLAAGVRHGGNAPRHVYGQPVCPRCGSRTSKRAQGDDGRTTWWCPGCQVPGVTAASAYAASPDRGNPV
jgi:endonuclease-8